jgi:cyclopropane fatty-acyl-phospholipid synthase-like methyltransferase
MTLGTIPNPLKFLGQMETKLLQKILSKNKWDEVYQQLKVEEMPWFSPKLDHDIEKALEELGIKKGSALDIGTGPGTQAIELAKRGFKVTAIDISETAIHKASQRARGERVKISFKWDDILNSKLDDRFNLVVDRGCFHVINPPQRADYVIVVHNILKARGYLFLKCFSHKEPPGPGPYRFKPDEITELFEPLFEIHEIKESSFRGTLPKPPKALFCILQKRVK